MEISPGVWKGEMPSEKRDYLGFRMWMIIILYIDRMSMTKIARYLDCAYSSMHGTVKEMERQGLIMTEITGRIKKFTLTEKGKKIQDALYIAINELGRLPKFNVKNGI